MAAKKKAHVEVNTDASIMQSMHTPGSPAGVQKQVITSSQDVDFDQLDLEYELKKLPKNKE